MKRSTKKLLSFALVTLVTIQFSFVFQRKAQAGSLDTVKSVLGYIEAIVVPWPLPIKSSEIFALIDLVDTCQDTSDAGLMTCLKGSSSNPTLGPLMKSDEGWKNLELGLKIYIDLKNSDYVQLIQDGGKPIACAAAQIFTGFDICGAMEELIAVAEAVGDAIEYSLSWLDDLDVALFGQTPHMDKEQYFSERWRPYISDFMSQKMKGNVTGDSVLVPHLPAWVFSHGGTYAEFGLNSKSLNQVYNDCTSYYAGFKDSNGGANCDYDRNTFNSRIDLLSQEAAAVEKMAGILQGVLDGQTKIWKDKYDGFVADLKKNYPDQDVMNPANSPSWVKNLMDAYPKAIASKIGTITAGAYCADKNGFDCVDFPKGSGTPYKSIAEQAFSNLYQSDFKMDMTEAINKAVGDAQPKLQTIFEDMKSKVNGFWHDKLSSVNGNKKYTLVSESFQAVMALRGQCKTLTGILGDDKYATLCYNSEPLASCFTKIDEIVKNPVSETDTKAMDAFIASVKPGMDQCIASSTEVVNEWKRMDSLQKPFIDGWADYYHKHYHSKDKSKEIPVAVMNFSLSVAYAGCVDANMKQVTQKAVNASSGIIMIFIGKPNTQFNYIPMKASAGLSKIRKKKPMYAKQPPVIAENFCKAEGQEVANPELDYADPMENAFTPTGEPQAAIDPKKRDPNEVAKAKQTASLSGCTVYEWTDASGKHSDDFHMMCNSLDAYGKCVHALGGDIRPSAAQCSPPMGRSIDTDYVIGPCCQSTVILTDKHKHEVRANHETPELVKGGAKAKEIFQVLDKTFKVTPNAGMGGSLTPMGPQTAKQGEKLHFTISPNAGYKIRNINGCGVSLRMGNIYETAPVTADCSFTVTFEAEAAAGTPSGMPMRTLPGHGAPALGTPTGSPQAAPALTPRQLPGNVPQLAPIQQAPMPNIPIKRK